MTQKTIAVLGAGIMGRGIAYASAVGGFRTILQDLEGAALEKAVDDISASLEKGVALGKVDGATATAAHKRLTITRELQQAACEADLVIEAVPESVELKRDLYARVEPELATTAILASNTSSIPIGRLADGLLRPERFLGLHFFNPVPLMKLLEIVVGPRTAPEVVETARALAARLGKDAIVVKDAPGFATSRLGVALGLEAIRMLEEGVASAADIDRAMELGYGHPMGPLRLTDLVGLDVRLAIARTLEKELGPRFTPPRLLIEKVAEGALGKKSGRGFYDWDPAAG